MPGRLRVKMKWVIFLIFAAIGTIREINGLRKFYRGKRFEWESQNLKASSPIDTELWFEQILDHFEPTNNATWKQV